MDKRSAGLIFLLILVLLFGCVFVDGFRDHIIQSIQCMDSTIQCVRVIP